MVWNLKLLRDCANDCCTLENSEKGREEGRGQLSRGQNFYYIYNGGVNN